MSDPAVSSSLRDRWFVTNGSRSMGPVSYSAVTRDLANGRLHGQAHLRHQSWRVWRRISDVHDLDVVSREQMVTRLAQLSELAVQVSDPGTCTTCSGEFLLIPQADSSPPPSSLRPRNVDPVGVLSGAKNLDQALLITLCTAVSATGAELGLLHRGVGGAQAGVYTVAALGDGAENLLGVAMPQDDPALRAAREGRTLLPEAPTPGGVSAIGQRLESCCGPVQGVAMVPIAARQELVGLLELGRKAGSFKAREISRVEDVVDALVARSTVNGWF